MNEVTARELWELVQRARIEDTLKDYCHYVDRNDPDGIVGQVFCADGCFELGSRHAVVGHAQLRLMFAKTLAAFSMTSHHLSNVTVRFTGEDSAESTAYVYAWHLATEDGRRIDLWGRYHDRLRLLSQGWRIASRRLIVAGTDGWLDPPFELPERLPNPVDPPSPRIEKR
jgi:hypothetical protein